MKALSMRPEWAIQVVLGYKSVECRTWATDHRGPLLVCSSSRKSPGSIAGHALCVVDVEGVEPFGPEHLEAACMYPEEMPDAAYAWRLSEPRLVEPFPVKGRLRLFDVPDGLVKPTGMEPREALSTLYEPLMTWKGLGVPEREVREWWAEALDCL